MLSYQLKNFLANLDTRLSGISSISSIAKNLGFDHNTYINWRNSDFLRMPVWRLFVLIYFLEGDIDSAKSLAESMKQK